MFIETGKKDRPVYITGVRQNFLECDGIDLILDLTKFNDQIRRVFLRAPDTEIETEEQSSFVREYLFAEVHNILSALGGKRLDIYTDISCVSLMGILNEIPKTFGVGVSSGLHGSAVRAIGGRVVLREHAGISRPDMQGLQK